MRWIWNGSPESFFHPRDVDWNAIASSPRGDFGDFGGFGIFYGEDRSIPELLKGSMGASERSKWSEDSAFEQAGGPFFGGDVEDS